MHETRHPRNGIIVRERFQQAANPQLPLEDRIFFSRDFVVAVNGERDARGRILDGSTIGALAAEVIVEAFGNLDSGASVDEAVILATSGMDQLAQRMTAEFDVGGDRPRASFVAYSRRREEVWRVGDCGFLIGGQLNMPEDGLTSAAIQARRAVLESNRLQGISPQAASSQMEARHVVAAILQKRSAFENVDMASPFAHGVVNGNHIPSRFIEVFELFDGPEDIVLATPGYQRLAEDLVTTEAILATQAVEDPYCIRLVRALGNFNTGGSWTDRTYLRIGR